MRENTDRKKIPLVYLIGKYPCHTETFIEREIGYMKDHFELRLFALSSDGTVRKSITVCPPALSVETLRRHLRFLFQHPLFYIRFLASAIRSFGVRGLRIFLRALCIYPQLRDSRVRHIHAHFADHPTSVARLLADRLGIRYSLSAHAHDLYTRNRDLYTNARNALFITTCTRYNHRYLSEMAPGEPRTTIHLNYHGVDLSRWRYQPRKQFDRRILTVGRLVEKKGHRYLLEAMYLLKRSGRIYHWFIVGEGPLRKLLEESIRKYGLTGQVHLAGYQRHEDLERYYHGCSVLIQPCMVTGSGDRDGLPNVILEAMACGTPVISTGISGIGEILDPDCGIKVGEKNGMALAEALIRLEKEEIFRRRIIGNARQKVLGFDSTEHLKGLKNVFDSYLS